MSMDVRQLLEFLSVMEQMKSHTRHCWTSDGVHETVAAHSWRLALLALLTAPELPGVDMDKVLKMCVLHDIGEAVTGDVPSFLKTEEDETGESRAVEGLLAGLGEPLRGAWSALFAEMDALETDEAKVYKALDRMEAVIQHNESPLDTWLPLEYQLQRTYGQADAEPYPFLRELRAEVLRLTEEKVGGTAP